MTTLYNNLTFAFIDYGDYVNYEYLNITGKSNSKARSFYRWIFLPKKIFKFIFVIFKKIFILKNRVSFMSFFIVKFLGYTETCTGKCNIGLVASVLENQNEHSNQYLLTNTEFTTNAFIKTIQIKASQIGLIRLDVK